MNELTAHERSIFHRRRLTEEIGRELGVSKERVRQIEDRALRKLKIALERRVESSADLLPG